MTHQFFASCYWFSWWGVRRACLFACWRSRLHHLVYGCSLISPSSNCHERLQTPASEAFESLCWELRGSTVSLAVIQSSQLAHDWWSQTICKIRLCDEEHYCSQGRHSRYFKVHCLALVMYWLTCLLRPRQRRCKYFCQRCQLDRRLR